MHKEKQCERNDKVWMAKRFHTYRAKDMAIIEKVDVRIHVNVDVYIEPTRDAKTLHINSMTIND
jgi:hypothetical protein